MIEKFYHLFPEEIIEAFGWTIFHSIWQISLIAIVLVTLLVLLNKFSARIKYILAFLALASALIWSTSTWYSSYTYALKKTEIKKAVLANPVQVAELLKEKIVNQPIANKKGQKTGTLERLKFKATLQPFIPLVFFFWVLGVLFFLFRMTGGMLYIMQLRNRHILPLGADWLTKIKGYMDYIRINKKVEVLQSSLAKVPMIIGYFKPVLLFPASLISGLGTKEIEAIIVHELAHIKRNDYLFNIIQSFIETIFFYHPAIWIISKIIRNERENSCDDLALKITQDKLSYIKALAASQNYISLKPQQAVAFASKGGLLNRVKRIQNHTHMKKKGLEGFIATSLIFISIILLSFTFERSNPKDDEYYDNETTVRQTSPGDTLPKVKKHRTKIVKSKKTDQDSLDIVVENVSEDLQDIPDEMEQLIEIAYTTNNDSLAEVIRHSIDLAMKEIDKGQYKIDISMKDYDEQMKDFDEHMKDFEMSMKEYDESMKDYDINMKDFDKAMEEMDKELRIHGSTCNNDSSFSEIELQVIINNAMKEAEKAMQDHEQIIIIKQKALEEAQAKLEKINIDSIIMAAQKDAQIHVKEALQDIDIEKIIQDAMSSIEEQEINGQRKVIIKKTVQDEPDIEEGTKTDLEQQLKELETK